MENRIIIHQEQFLALSNPQTQELVAILAKKDGVELAHYEKKITLDVAIEGTTLKALTKVINDKNLTKALTYIITRFSNNFNVGKKFTDDQAIIMAMDIQELYQYETIEDMVLMFKMARTGQIGDGKDFKLDSQTVFHKWIPEYLEQKAIARQRKHDREKNLSFNRELSLEEVRKFNRKLKEKNHEKYIRNKIDEITKDFNLAQLDELIAQWSNNEQNLKYVKYLKSKRLTTKP
jgi:hypothetical protein